ncbi:MAG TPA: hypothetical protein VN577_09975 [Terriglobales bacterium]|nr:hypothetical protein [Terriglobales bacterium]
MADAPQDDKIELTGMARRMANLKKGHRWQAGQSGNPSGMPKAVGLITQAYNRILAMEVPDEMLIDKYEGLKGSGITFGDLLALSTSMKAIYLEQKPATSLAAAKEITDRTEGKVPMRIAGADGGALEVINLSDDERRQRLLRLAEVEVIDAEFEDLAPAEMKALPEGMDDTSGND